MTLTAPGTHPKAEPATPTPVLSVRDLNVSFPSEAGPVRAVRDVSFDVHAGRTLGVVGESGSGKSATAMGIMGLLPGSASVSGRVLLGGRDLVGLDDRRLSAVRGNDIGMVFQDPLSTLTPIFSIGQHYRLTELGLSLEGPLPLLRLSAETHMPEIDRNNRAADQSSKPWIY